jgi:hypothetical protein
MHKTKAQATIEFAVVIGVVIILAIGAIQSLFAFYVTRQVRAATEEIADVAAVHGADVDAIAEQVPAILAQHRLDGALAEWEIVPTPATYLEPITVTLRYNLAVRLYGLFDLPIPPQQVRRLCEGG